MEQTARQGQTTARVVDLGRQTALLTSAALLYFGVRAITEGSKTLALRHAQEILSFERRFHIDIEHTLQHDIVGRSALVTAANWVYIFGHWPVIIAAFVWLYSRHRYQYRLLRNAMFVSGAIGLLIFWRFPAAPPRRVPGFVDTVTRYSHA
jgi:hypothetical protein